MNKGFPIFFHTNAPAPYRQHMFELLSKRFLGCRFCFYERQASDRPWGDKTTHWRCMCNHWYKRIGIGKFKFTPELVKATLLCRPGVVHVFASAGTGCDRVFILFLALIRWIRLIIWNDAGFPESVAEDRRVCWPWHVQVLFWLQAKLACGMFTAGKLGREYGLACGFKNSQIINTFFSHDVNRFASYRKTHYLEARARIRTMLGIKDSSVSSLNISRYLDWKRLCDLAQAFTVLEKQNPEVAKRCELILIGDGESKDHLPILEKLKLVKVHFVHQMPPNEVMDYYCASDLFVFPSEGDIWGLVVNEALSMGLPVICTDRIGAAELIQDGENGFKVPVRDPDAMAEKLRMLAENDVLRAKLSKNAEHIGDIWRTDRGVDEFEAFLERLK